MTTIANEKVSFEIKFVQIPLTGYTLHPCTKDRVYIHRFLALLHLCLGVSNISCECFMLFLVIYIVELYYSNYTILQFICINWNWWPWICSACRIITIRSFPHLWLVSGFVTRVTWQVPLVEEELHTLPKHQSSPRILVMFVLSICSFLCSVL